MDYWSMGELEYWVLNASLHYSITPVFQSLVRRSEAIERNEVYESFSAAVKWECLWRILRRHSWRWVSCRTC